MIWDEWASITRFLESSRFTLLPAAMRWEELLQLNPIAANLEFEAQGTLYRVSLDQHISALRDLRPLYSSALLLYYALAEAAAADRLSRDDLVGCNGIEDWAERLLSAAGVGWLSEDERLGIVEVGVMRNLVAHGEREYSKRAVAKLAAAGVCSPPSVGDRVVLDYEILKQYRSRLKSLLNRGGLGSVAVEQANRADSQEIVVT
ncbi:MAG: hypothetical protein HGA39_09200 [Coriobacteriia bacterium]|nr:hypothetical protein [Coriobacteriia bacterium]